MTTAEILQKLHGLSEAPWNDLKGKPLGDRALAFRLREYEVKSRTLNLGGESRAKGYTREDLHDVWQRYLPPLPPTSHGSVTSVTRVPSADLQGPGVTDVTGNERSVTDEGDEENPDESSTGTDVTDVTLVAGDGGRPPPDTLLRAPSNSVQPPLCDNCGRPATNGQRWDWPGRPFGINLHSSCEAPWFDSERRQ